MTDGREVLVAGIGNVFCGDDGFGVAVARRLTATGVPPGIRVGDFGTRGLDLGLALLDDWRGVILVDACPRGGAPGSLYVLEPALDEAPEHERLLEAAGGGHGMHPLRVLEFVRANGKALDGVRIVACEPAELGSEEEVAVGLSPAVEAAVGPAAALVVALARTLGSGWGAGEEVGRDA